MARSEPLPGGMTMLAYFLLGIALGAGSSVVPGPCGLAVIDAAMRVGRRRGLEIAIGSALGDLTYGAIGVLGIGHAVAASPELVAVLLAASGAMLIGYGLVAVLCRPSRTAAPRPLGGVLVGFATLVCNPGALVMWCAVGIQLAGASHAARICAAVGIGCGSLAWFAAMAYVAARGKAIRLHRLVDVIGCMLVVYGAVTLARAFL